jgi:putative two-component system response regulator
MTIVLVDDDGATLAIQKRYTKKFCGVEPMAFTDPEKAAAYLKGNKADLIVVDYSMPKLSGIDLIHAVREGSPNQTTPIVMVTSAAFESVKGKVMLAGAQDFLTKPVSAEEFKERVLSLAGSEAKALEPSH